MYDISIKIPKEILLKLHQDEKDFARYIKKILAMDLYKNRQISLGRCADIAEMTKKEFIQYLGGNSISIFSITSKGEFLEELENA